MRQLGPLEFIEVVTPPAEEVVPEEDVQAAKLMLAGFGHETLRSVRSSDVIQRIHSELAGVCLLYTSPSPRDRTRSRMPSSA